MSSRRGSSNSSFRSADGASSRGLSNEHREKFHSVDNLHLHQNASKRDSHHFRRASSNQNNGAEQEFTANAGRASYRRDSSTPDPAEGTRRRLNSKQAHSTVDLQDRIVRRHSRQVNSTIDLQASRTRHNSRQAPRFNEEETSMRRTPRQPPPEVAISDRRHSRQTLILDGAEGTNSRHRNRQAHSTVNLQGTSGQHHYRQAQSTVDLPGTRRISRHSLSVHSAEGMSGRRNYRQTEDNRPRNPRQAFDTADLESNSSRRSSRQALSLDGVESTRIRCNSRQALGSDAFEGTGRRRNSRNAFDTVDVQSNSSRRSSRQVPSLDGLEGTSWRHNSRQALSLDGVEGIGRRRRNSRNIDDVDINSSRRGSRQALSLDGKGDTGRRRSSRQALDTVDVGSNSSRRSFRQAPASQYAGEASYHRNPNEAPDSTDLEEASPERHSQQMPNLRRPDSSQTYSSSDPEGSPSRRDELPPENAEDRVLSSDDPEASPKGRNVQQVYSSDDAASPRGHNEPRSNVILQGNLRRACSADEAGRRSNNQVSEDVASRRASCVAFSSDDAEGDISRRTSCMGMVSGDTGGTISDRSSIEELSSEELEDGDKDVQGEEEFHDADDGRPHHSSNTVPVLPPGPGEGEVFSDNQSDGDAGDGWTRTRPHQDVDQDLNNNPVSNRQRAFAQDEGDITDDMLAVYLSGGHTRSNYASKKAHSFHGETSSRRKRPKFRSQGDLRYIHLRSNKGLEEFDDYVYDVDEDRSSRRSSVGLPVLDEAEEFTQTSADEESYFSKEGARLQRGSLKTSLCSNRRRSEQCSSSSSFDDEDEDDGRSSNRFPPCKGKETASNKSSKISFYTAKEKASMPNMSKSPHVSKGAISKRPKIIPLRSNAKNKTYNEPKGPRKVSPSRKKEAVTKVAPNSKVAPKSKGAVPKTAPNSRGMPMKAVPSPKGAVPKPQLNNTQYLSGNRRFSSNLSFRNMQNCVSDAGAELAFYSAMDVTSSRPSRTMINAAGVCAKCTMICKKENMLEGEIDTFYCRSCYEKLHGSPRPIKSFPFSVHYSSTTLCTETTADSMGLKVEACTDMGAACTKCVTMMNVKDMEKIDNKYYCHPCLDKMNSPGGMEDENKLVNETDMEKFIQMFPNPEEFVCLQPESMEDKELISVKPLKCPKITCRKHVSTTHIESHFRVEHREIPILTTKLGRLITMEMLPNEINYGCKVIMLLNVDDYDFPLTSPLTANLCTEVRPYELDRPNPKPVMALLCARIPPDELAAYSSDLLSEYSFKPYGGSETVPDVMPEDEKIIFWVASNMFTGLSYAVCISTRDTERRQKFCGDIRGLEELPIELSASGHSLTLLHYHTNRMSRKGKKPLNVSVVIHHPPEKKA